MIDLKDFWTLAHKHRDARWLALSEPKNVIERLGIDLDSFQSILEVGPGVLYVADYLESLGKRVVLHDIVALEDPRYVAQLPLLQTVDAALAHLVLQHVPTDAQRELVLGVLWSLHPGGKFYFDAVTEECHDNAELAKEFAVGTSFPFIAWEFVTSKREVSPGYFFCVAEV